MKKLIGLLLSLFLFVVGFSQDAVLRDDVRPASTVSTTKAVEIRIIRNGWRESGGPYDDRLLSAILAQVANDRCITLASSTRELLDESQERDQLSGNRWVDQQSPRLQTGTLVPALLAWEVVTGGSTSGSRTNNYQIAGVTLQSESGSVAASIAVTLKDLTTGLRLAAVTGRGNYSSTNITDFDYRSWFSKNRIPISWQAWDNDAAYRRAMIATERAVEDLARKIPQLYTPRDGSRQ